MDPERQKICDQITEAITKKAEYWRDYREKFIQRLDDDSNNERRAVYYDSYKDECQCSLGHTLLKGKSVSSFWLNPPRNTFRCCPGCDPYFTPHNDHKKCDPTKLYTIDHANKFRIGMIEIHQKDKYKPYGEIVYFFCENCWTYKLLDICNKFKNIGSIRTVFKDDIDWKVFCHDKCGLCKHDFNDTEKNEK